MDAEPKKRRKRNNDEQEVDLITENNTENNAENSMDINGLQQTIKRKRFTKFSCKFCKQLFSSRKELYEHIHLDCLANNVNLDLQDTPFTNVTNLGKKMITLIKHLKKLIIVIKR